MRYPDRMRAIAVTALLASAWPASAALPAVEEAARAGEIIGAASVCGVAESRLIATGQLAIYRIRDMTTSAEELRQAQAAHGAAVDRGAAAIRSGRETCAGALRRFEAIEARGA